MGSRSKKSQDGLALALRRPLTRSLGIGRRRQARCVAARELAPQRAPSALAAALLPFACAGCCGATRSQPRAHPRDARKRALTEDLGGPDWHWHSPPGRGGPVAQLLGVRFVPREGDYGFDPWLVAVIARVQSAS